MTSIDNNYFTEHFRRFLNITQIPLEYHKEIARYLQLFMESHDYEAAYCEHRRREKAIVAEIHSTTNALRRRSRNAKLPTV